MVEVDRHNAVVICRQKDDDDGPVVDDTGDCYSGLAGCVLRFVHVSPVKVDLAR